MYLKLIFNAMMAWWKAFSLHYKNTFEITYKKMNGDYKNEKK